MFKEMLSVTILLCIIPMFSLFVHQDRLWLFVNIARNILLMIISSIIPIILSYINKDTIQFLTSDMLTSLSLILQNSVTLTCFENFLQVYNKDEGPLYLELYLTCELYFNLHDIEIAKKIITKIHNLDWDLPCFCPHDAPACDEKSFLSLYSFCAVTLEQDFFPAFKESKEFNDLRRFIYRQEIVNDRISATSLRRSGSKTKASMIKLLTFNENV